MTRTLLVVVPLVALLALPASVPAQVFEPPLDVARPAEPAVIVPAHAHQPAPVGEDQDRDRPLRLLVRDIGGDLVHMVSWRSATWIGGAGALAAPAHMLDDDLSKPPGQEWAKWSEVFDPGTYIGRFDVLVGASTATYAMGKMTGRPRMAHVGRDLIRTQVVSQLLVQGLKLGVKRNRPDLSADNSFPSGHAASTFASAVVFQRHLGRRWAWVTYGVATYVAVSRMHENKHHLSDVIFGAGVGVASGYSTTRHATARWTLAPVAVPGGAAVMVAKGR